MGSVLGTLVFRVRALPLVQSAVVELPQTLLVDRSICASPLSVTNSPQPGSDSELVCATLSLELMCWWSPRSLVPGSAGHLAAP